ncbi:MerR family transcriptional regulator [Nocardia sp. NPDC052566]|uniref:MerR family transcriptional regulator n=1 Tax=Nocardia sp. NPDC052566 TaxID=3364330 RepID=UPI0037C9828D
MTENTLRDLLSIGDLSRLTGVPVRTLRFYCDDGILESRRSGGGHRMFDPVTAVDRVVLLRRLRALGLSLAAITEVLTGARSIGEVVAAERAALDTELGVLAWRRASLRAVEDAPHPERAARLELLAAVQDRHRAHDGLVAFWRRLLTPIPPAMFDGFVAMNIPDLPADPAPRQLVAFAELVTRAADPALSVVMSRQLWRANRSEIHDRPGLVTGVAEACMSVDSDGLIDTEPRPGAELDHFMAAHADARRVCDTPRFRRQLLAAAADGDERIHRYWQLTSEITETSNAGAALDWLYQALTRSVAAAA